MEYQWNTNGIRLEAAQMNGEEIPGLMDGVRAWIHRNQDPETGLVFGLTVGEPLEEQTSKTYLLKLDTPDKHLMVIIWDKGCLFVEKADLTLGVNAPDAEVCQAEQRAMTESQLTSGIIASDYQGQIGQNALR